MVEVQQVHKAVSFLGEQHTIWMFGPEEEVRQVVVVQVKRMQLLILLKAQAEIIVMIGLCQEMQAHLDRVVQERNIMVIIHRIQVTQITMALAAVAVGTVAVLLLKMAELVAVPATLVE